MIEPEIPKAFKYLNKPMRFKGAYGGRGSAKSWSIATLLLLLAKESPLKILCGREYQKSIDDSVKSLLDNRIQSIGLSKFYDSKKNFIIGKNKSIFLFRGLRHEPQKLKSIEAVDIFWGEEANTISTESLEILIPTIRKDGSELWFTYNRRLTDEPVHQLSRRENADFRKINYDRNPFFPDVLRREMEFDKQYNYEKYLHVWEGEPQQVSEAQVFRGKYRIESFETPADAQFYYGADWGFSVDPSVVVRCFIDGRRLFIDQEAYRVGVEVQDLPTFFDQVPGTDKWKITADSARPETIRYMQRQGYNVVPAKKGKDSVHDGVEFLKSFEIVIHERCKHAAYEFGAYSYKTDRLSGDVLPVLEDKDNHCIAKGQVIKCLRGDIPIENVTTNDHVFTRDGFKPVLFSGKTGTNRRIINIKTNNGNSLLCTSDHLIWTSNGFVKADSLRYGDELISIRKESPCQQRDLSLKDTFIGVIQNLKIRATGAISRHLSRENSDIYTGICGSISTARFQTDTTSTISMEMPGTITSLILNVFRSATISKNTITMKDIGNRKNISTGLDHSPKHGTGQTRAIKSMLKLVEWPTRISSRKKSDVNSAKSGFFQDQLEIKICSVQTNASQHGAGKQASITKKGSAPIAEKNSHVTNIVRPNIVVDHVLTVREIPQASCSVYDLTVKDKPEFFANGILVHNCIDAIRYSTETLMGLQFDDLLKMAVGQ